MITDLDISKCNRYLVTASKDGKIIVWDWKKCLKIDEINEHTTTVSNLKFFTLSNSSSSKDDRLSSISTDEMQVLVSCSEDGTIKLYDEINFLEAPASDSG